MTEYFVNINNILFNAIIISHLFALDPTDARPRHQHRGGRRRRTPRRKRKRPIPNTYFRALPGLDYLRDLLSAPTEGVAAPHSVAFNASSATMTFGTIMTGQMTQWDRIRCVDGGWVGGGSFPFLPSYVS